MLRRPPAYEDYTAVGLQQDTGMHLTSKDSIPEAVSACGRYGHGLLTIELGYFVCGQPTEDYSAVGWRLESADLPCSLTCSLFCLLVAPT